MSIALLALLLVQINFGILPIAQKLTLTTLTPLALFSIRSVMGALTFQIAFRLWRKYQNQESLFTPSSPKVYLGLSLLGISLNQFLLILALTMTSAVAAVIVVPSITLFTYLFAVLLRKEPFMWSKAGILLLGGTGVFILFGDGLLQVFQGLDHSSFVGNLLCLISAAVYALYLVISREHIAKQPALMFTSHMFSWALVWTSLLMVASIGFFLWKQPGAPLYEIFLHSPALIPLNSSVAPEPKLLVWMIIFIISGPTVINYFLNLWALKTLPASTVSGFISLQTLIGASLSHFYLGEEIKASYGLAAFCILLSVILLSIGSFRRTSLPLPIRKP